MTPFEHHRTRQKLKRISGYLKQPNPDIEDHYLRSIQWNTQDLMSLISLYKSELTDHDVSVIWADMAKFGHSEETAKQSLTMPTILSWGTRSVVLQRIVLSRAKSALTQ